MMHREEFLKKHPNIKGSMVAYNERGEKLGKITTLFDDSFNIEKGLFFPRDYSLSYDDVLDVHDNEMIVSLHGGEPGEKAGEEKAEKSAESLKGRESFAAAGMASGIGINRIDELNKGGEIEIPLREEDLRVQKTEEQKSEVHVRKFVHTEDRTMTVPVRSEELVVERTRPSASGENLAADEAAFREEDLTIPLMEEHVEVQTSQHVRETVHLRKESHLENQDVKGKVRIEDMKIETEDKMSVKEKGSI